MEKATISGEPSNLEKHHQSLSATISIGSIWYQFAIIETTQGGKISDMLNSTTGSLSSVLGLYSR